MARNASNVLALVGVDVKEQAEALMAKLGFTAATVINDQMEQM